MCHIDTRSTSTLRRKLQCQDARRLHCSHGSARFYLSVAAQMHLVASPPIDTVEPQYHCVLGTESDFAHRFSPAIFCARVLATSNEHFWYRVCTLPVYELYDKLSLPVVVPVVVERSSHTAASFRARPQQQCSEEGGKWKPSLNFCRKFLIRRPPNC